MEEKEPERGSLSPFAVFEDEMSHSGSNQVMNCRPEALARKRSDRAQPKDLLFLSEKQVLRFAHDDNSLGSPQRPLCSLWLSLSPHASSDRLGSAASWSGSANFLSSG